MESINFYLSYKCALKTFANTEHKRRTQTQNTNTGVLCIGLIFLSKTLPVVYSMTNCPKYIYSVIWLAYLKLPSNNLHWQLTDCNS